MAAPGDPIRVLPRAQTFMALALVSLATIPVVLSLGRAARPRNAAVVAMLIGAVVSGALAYAHRGSRLPPAVLTTTGAVLMAIPSTALGWFLGPNSAYLAFLVLALVVTGMASSAEARGPLRFAGWLIYAALAGGIAAVFFGVISGALDDASLSRTLLPGHPTSDYVLGHLFMQGVFLVAFATGRRVQRRYAKLATGLAATMRATGRRDALLVELRAGYLRTLEFARAGLRAEPAASSEPAAPGSRRMAQDGVDRTVLDVSAHVGLDVLLREGPLLSQALAQLVNDLAPALQTLHLEGSEHGAITPAAIVFDRSEDTWVLRDRARLQRSAAEVLAYRAPEHVMGRSLGVTADTYSLAAVLYEAVTGVAPYYELPTSSLAKAIPVRLPIAPRRFANVPEPLESLLHIGLSRRPRERFRSALDLQQAFALARAGDPRGHLRRRCRALTDDWERGTRILEALVETHSPATVLREPATEVETGPPPTLRSLASDFESKPASSVVQTEAWREAYDAKMKSQRRAVVIACGVGAVTLALIGRNPIPRNIGLICIAGIAATVWASGWLERRRPDAPPVWPWPVVAMLSVGPLASIGLLSGLAGLVALALFSGGVFSLGNRAIESRRPWVLGGLVLTQTALFVSVLTGWIPDRGNVPLLAEGGSIAEPLLGHALILMTYTAAHVAGTFVDRRYAALSRQAEQAEREAAKQELLLAEAREELDRLKHTGGMFTGLTVARYEVGELIGRGGMGEVYAARLDGRGETLALKLIRGDRASSSTVLRLFLEEAESMRRIDSPYVARVFEVADVEQDLPFIAMELVEGRSLAEVLRERERLELEDARRLVRDMARGLADVHAAGVLHCDIKPGNVLHTEAGRWKLVDFGVARRRDTALGRTAQAGTPAYMAPEQAMGGEVDERSDLYALCLVAYGAVVGRPAFIGSRPSPGTPDERVPPDPARWIDLPEDLRLALRQGLATSPSERFQSAAQLAIAFEQAFDGRLPEEARLRAARLKWG
ncbi:MAG: protein kinase [Sandaracinaceae bacterium]